MEVLATAAQMSYSAEITFDIDALSAPQLEKIKVTVTAKVAASKPGATCNELRNYVVETALTALKAESARVLDKLTQIRQQAMQKNDFPLQNAVLRCLSDWVYAGFIDTMAFQSHALFRPLFDAVRVPALTVNACRVLTGLLSEYTALADVELEAQLRRLAFFTLPLLSHFKSLVTDGSFSEAAALGHVFVDLALSSREFITPSRAAMPWQSASLSGDDFGLALLEAVV